MAKSAGYPVGLFAKAHDGAQRLMIGKASPRIERQNVVRIGAACRAVRRLRPKRDSSQRLMWRNFFGPFDRGVLDGSALQIGAELSTKLVLCGVSTEKLNDRIEQGIVVLVGWLACEPKNRLRDRGSTELRDIVAKADSPLRIKTLSDNVVTGVAERVKYHWNLETGTVGQLDGAACRKSNRSEREIRRSRLEFETVLCA